MRIVRTGLLGLLLISAACAQDMAISGGETLRDQLRKATAEGRVSGAAHLVVREGKTVYSDAIGFADVEAKTPFRTDSIIRIYSMTKPIITVAALTLLERGKFQLDDSVARYLPVFTNATVLEKDGDSFRRVPPRRALTIRDVLRHTTGYSYGDEPAVREDYQREGLRYWGHGDMFPPKMSIAKAADALARIPALHHPGEKFTYGYSTDLLGRLIEVWSGQPLDVYLQQAVLKPLEMVDTDFSIPREKRGRFTSCHTLKDGKLELLDPAGSSPFNEGFEFLSGGGGLLSTVEDYAHFCQMLVDAGLYKDRRILQPETVRQMFTDQLSGVAGNFKFGLGFGIAEVKIGSGAGARTAERNYWGGYASTEFAVVPSERLFQIFARQQIPDPHDLAQAQFARVYEGLVPNGPAAAVAIPLTAPTEASLGTDGYAQSGDLKIHYVTRGQGPLLVMIHGFPDYWYTWRRQIPALSESFQVVAMDQRGYNLSGQPAGVTNYAMDKLVGDVRAVIQHFHRDQAVVVGHDWGGMVAWSFAMAHPEMTDRLVILNLPHPNGLRRELANNPEQQKNSAYARHFQKPEAAGQLTAEGLAGLVRDETARPNYIAAFRRSSFEGMLNYYKANYPREPYLPLTEVGPKVKCPVLMFHGLKDKALLPSALNDTWKWLEKDLTLVTVPEADHWVQQDAPDLVTRTMVKWLKP